MIYEFQKGWSNFGSWFDTSCIFGNTFTYNWCKWETSQRFFWTRGRFCYNLNWETGSLLTSFWAMLCLIFIWTVKSLTLYHSQLDALENWVQVGFSSSISYTFRYEMRFKFCWNGILLWGYMFVVERSRKFFVKNCDRKIHNLLAFRGAIWASSMCNTMTP